MTPATPYRQIRAQYDADTVTVYQAYNASIAVPAVAHQKLDASDHFRPSRMTWIKPSWCWMMYRAGYSYKDRNQAHILAIRMTRAGFETLLRNALVASHTAEEADAKEGKVRVQWDPERSPTLDKLAYRSIQIGIPAAFSETWINEWIAAIEDVTERAKELKAVVDAEPDVDFEHLVSRGLVPLEKEYPVGEEISRALRMEHGEESR